MNDIKRIFFTVLIFTSVVLIYRGWFYRHVVTYKSIGLRTNYLATDDKFIDYIDSGIDIQSHPDVVHIIKLGISLTSSQLNFTIHKNENDPNKLFTTKKANCVGYAAFFATTCNYLFKKYNLNDSWTAIPQIGQLYFLGTNIHKYLKSPFFKDHDFVIIKNISTGEILAVDPTVSDYLCIYFIAYTN